MKASDFTTGGNDREKAMSNLLKTEKTDAVNTGLVEKADKSAKALKGDLYSVGKKGTHGAGSTALDAIARKRKKTSAADALDGKSRSQITGKNALTKKVQSRHNLNKSLKHGAKGVAAKATHNALKDSELEGTDDLVATTHTGAKLAGKARKHLRSGKDALEKKDSLGALSEKKYRTEKLDKKAAQKRISRNIRWGQVAVFLVVPRRREIGVCVRERPRLFNRHLSKATTSCASLALHAARRLRCPRPVINVVLPFMPADVTLPDDFRSVLYNHFIRRYAAIQLRQIIECHLRVLGCKVVYPLFQFSPGAVRAASLPYLSLDWRSLPFPTAFLAFPPDALRATCHDIRWGQVAIPLVIPFLRNIGIACSQVRPTGNDYLSKTSGTPLAVPFLAEPSSPAIPAYRAFPCVFLIYL